jgi:tetratricopeptide (TPR) repeat protein
MSQQGLIWRAAYLIHSTLIIVWLSTVNCANAQRLVDGTKGSWSQYEYTWRSLHISIRTDAGVYSPSLQQLGKDRKTVGPFSSDKLGEFIQGFFVMTSGLRNDGEKDDFSLQFDRVLKQWGFGHALPIIAAVAIENLMRPIPSLFVHGVETYTAKDLTKVTAGSIDVSKPDTVKLVVYSNLDDFQKAASRSGHSFARAYYDKAAHEIGLMLDMRRFRALYSNLEQKEDRLVLLVPAFISFVSEAFNDDSGHEIAHFMQQQSSNRAYTLPAIAEGEAEVNGFTRSRDGLIYSLMYDTPDAWMQGNFDREVLAYRLELIQGAGRPPASPFEVQRFQELRTLQAQKKLIPIASLLSRNQDFYDGDDSDVRPRYLLSWALYLVAIRDPEVGELLRKAVDSRLSGRRLSDVEHTLDSKLAGFIDDPVEFKVAKQKILSDAEKVYRSDPSFAGLFYTWAYIADPLDVRVVVYLGDSLYRGGDLSSAQKYYNEARLLQPVSALPLLRLGDIQASVGNSKQAMELWRQAASTSSKEVGEELFRSIARNRSDEMLKSRKQP